MSSADTSLDIMSISLTRRGHLNTEMALSEPISEAGRDTGVSDPVITCILKQFVLEQKFP